MVLHTNDTLNEEDVLDGEFISIDDPLSDITEVPVVESIAEAVQYVSEGRKMLTRAKMRELTLGKEKTKKLADYMQGGLD
jgi:hypothetical protein